ncbi:HAD-IIIA family hydrolase [bacterium]|nr:HAD-IIIA family hydrolase [bacterium]
MASEVLKKKLEEIKILLLDVDGVMTNGKVAFNNSGEKLLAFDVKDGSGIRYLMRAGILVGIITGKKNEAILHRARELNIDIDNVHRNATNKVKVLENILHKQSFESREVLFMGDDLLDLAVMQRVGVSVAVADAVPEVLSAADYVTAKPGGSGAVREVCEMILKAQGKWDETVDHYRTMK